ncbi:uncharacterized protein LOC131483325 [Ochotona princeps]|uniref:uncharacterized protein LOC131483325 n=1 Tax=Ochotona princeps TaxID=9978 RepID=UPI0027145E7A|nr:uncharacterized protein LOC131483325 [Ochotona princeps]
MVSPPPPPPRRLPPVLGPPLRSPRPRRFLGGGANTPGAVGARRSRQPPPPPARGNTGPVRPSGGGAPAPLPAPARGLLGAPPRPAPAAHSRSLAGPPLAREPLADSWQPPPPADDSCSAASLPQPRSGRRDVTSVTSSERRAWRREAWGAAAPCAFPGTSGSCSSSSTLPDLWPPPRTSPHASSLNCKCVITITNANSVLGHHVKDQRGGSRQEGQKPLSANALVLQNEATLHAGVFLHPFSL